MRRLIYLDPCAGAIKLTTTLIIIMVVVALLLFFTIIDDFEMNDPDLHGNKAEMMMMMRIEKEEVLMEWNR